MRIAYTYSPHHRDVTAAGTGSPIHIRQFIANTLALGHEIWTWPSNQRAGTHSLPATRLYRILALRRMDVLYYRVDFNTPGSAHWGLPPYRQLIGSPLIVWEFNGVPEFGRIIGHSEGQIQDYIEQLRYYGRGCDLAICVSKAMTEYVREKIGLKRILTVPNGSDPTLFCPEATSVQRIQHIPDQLNVVWMGSGDLAWNRFDLLKQTAQLLWERNQPSQVAFHIIGLLAGGLMREMPPNVHYQGLESYDMLPHWLAAMDVGLCLYQPGVADYNSPLKLFDYMASGLTVVGTFQPQLAEVFSELNQTDLLVSPDDPAALAEILLGLAHNPERVRRQGEKSRQLVIDFYNWRRAVQDIMDEISRLLQERP
jgi:glycosyltransferase involved in cell wall biosynthesis